MPGSRDKMANKYVFKKINNEEATENKTIKYYQMQDESTFKSRKLLSFAGKKLAYMANSTAWICCQIC